MSTSFRTLLAAAIALACVACDQGTKHLAVGALRDKPAIEYLDRTVRLVYAENPGAWGSLGATWPTPLRQLVLVALPLAFVVFAGVQILRHREATRAEVVGLALLAGGGVGNLIDRIAHGYVVDFLWIGRGWLATNVFNVADVAIVAGALLLIVTARKPASKPSADDGPAPA